MFSKALGTGSWKKKRSEMNGFNVEIKGNEHKTFRMLAQ